MSDGATHAQLARMRAMNAMYHRRFFLDVWSTGVVWLALLVAGDLGAERAWAALPVVALLGAVLTAFDASYLVFARHYSAALERRINREIGEEVLVASQMEDAYLFRLGSRKVVTMGTPLTWFGFVTGFLTVLGITGYVTGAVLAREVVTGAAGAAYWTFLAATTTSTLAVGGWWFVGGAGERRLMPILDRL